MAKTLTFLDTRDDLGAYDGESLGWFIIDADGLAAAGSLMQTAADLIPFEVAGAPRGTIDVVIDTIDGEGAVSWLIRDPMSTVPTADTTGSDPAAVVFVEPSGTFEDRALVALLGVPVVEAGYAGWEINPTAGIARITDATSAVLEVVAGDNVTVDSSDPHRPVVSSTGGGSSPTWGEWSDPLLPAAGSAEEWIDTTPFSLTGLRWRKRTDGLVQLNGYAIYASDVPAPMPPTPDAFGFSTVVDTAPADIDPEADAALVPAFSSAASDPAAVAQVWVTDNGSGGFSLRALMGDAAHDTILVDGTYWAVPD